LILFVSGFVSYYSFLLGDFDTLLSGVSLWIEPNLGLFFFPGVFGFSFFVLENFAQFTELGVSLNML